jgi:chromosome transmission fidelity protein 18
MDKALDEFDMTDDFELKPKVAAKTPNQLWVDKYTSVKYFDLLTDEVTNRNVLTWIKTWDELVFPSNPKVSLRLPESITNKTYNSAGNINLNQFNNMSFMQQQQDLFSYKNKRVLLLYGPPGTGKSTMARFLARHCGYEP